MNLELVGYVAAALTTCSFLPQAVKTLRSRDTQAISLWMYVTFTAGVALWFLYGLMLGSWPVIISNAVTFLLAASILALKLMYR